MRPQRGRIFLSPKIFESINIRPLRGRFINPFKAGLINAEDIAYL
jgi:hypothetical protein